MERGARSSPGSFGKFCCFPSQPSCKLLGLCLGLTTPKGVQGCSLLWDPREEERLAW